MAHKVKIRYVNYHGSLCQRTLNPHDIQAIEELTGHNGKHAELNHSTNRLADELINFYLHKGLNIIENPINTIIINNSIQGKVAMSPSQSNSTNNQASEIYETKIFDHQRMYVTPIFEKLSVSPISLEEDNSIETIFLISSKNVREISSTNVRQILSLAGDVSNFMSTEIISYINSLKT